MNADDGKRSIGKVVSVTADRFVVELHGGTDNFTIVGFDDMEYVARLGSFLMIPAQDEYVVAEISGLRERDPTVGGSGPDKMEKSSSSKYLDLVPLGMLPKDSAGSFRFGVSNFPALYADALYALSAELDRIFETVEPFKSDGDEPTKWTSLAIGNSVIFDDYPVKLKIDPFFGGHSAILGNTGSGKSCTLASILQALFEKPNEHRARGSTFVIFDVNGEYSDALSGLKVEGEIGVRDVSFDVDREASFFLPHWFLDASEWELLLQASERAQVPILRSALGLTSLFNDGASADLASVRNHVLATCILQILGDESSSPSSADRITAILNKFGTAEISTATIGSFIRVRYGEMDDVESLTCFLQGDDDGDGGFLKPGFRVPDYQNTPFDFDNLGAALDLAILYEEAHGNRQIRDYCSSLLTRYKALQERDEFAFVRCTTAADGATFKQREYLSTILGLVNNEDRGYEKSHQIIILDMNSVDDEIVALVASVLSRMIFSILRRLDPRNRFPVHLVLEEAHRYICLLYTSDAADE